MKTPAMFAAAAALGAVLLHGSVALAAEVRVMISGGVSAAYKQLVPEFEKRTGHKVTTAFGPSMGTTENAIPVRIARGEPVDVLIMVGDALGRLIAEGKAVADTRVDLVRSPIGLAVKAGAPKPDISTSAALKSALLGAKSIAYSDSASGVYVETVLFARLGIQDQVHGKARMIPAEPVAAVVARGEAELGFQQISELLPVKGIDLLGPIPDDVQKITVFSAALAKDAKEVEAGRALIEFLISKDAAQTMKTTGLDPIH
jgi:molybdate transport system substrate-binding protein